MSSLSVDSDQNHDSSDDRGLMPNFDRRGGQRLRNSEESEDDDNLFGSEIENSDNAKRRQKEGNGLLPSGLARSGTKRRLEKKEEKKKKKEMHMQRLVESGMDVACITSVDKNFISRRRENSDSTVEPEPTKLSARQRRIAAKAAKAEEKRRDLFAGCTALPEHGCVNNEFGYAHANGRGLLAHVSQGENLKAENDEGAVEYKWRLCNVSESRLQNLVTQMKFRVAEGDGECLYELGIEDDGTQRGLTEDEINESINTLRRIAAELSYIVEVVHIRQVDEVAEPLRGSGVNKEAVVMAAGELRFCAEIKVRKLSIQKPNVRVAVVGEHGAGKSSLVGTLFHGDLDDGRGSVRQTVFTHKHELATGETSAVAERLLGFGPNGHCVNYQVVGNANGDKHHSHKHNNKRNGLGKSSNSKNQHHEYTLDRVELTHQAIVEWSSVLLTLLDLPGHTRREATMLQALLARQPQAAMIVVDPTQMTPSDDTGDGRPTIPASTAAHFHRCAALGIPFFVIITKHDQASPLAVSAAVVRVGELIQRHVCTKLRPYVASPPGSPVAGVSPTSVGMARHSSGQGVFPSVLNIDFLADSGCGSPSRASGGGADFSGMWLNDSVTTTSFDGDSIRGSPLRLRGTTPNSIDKDNVGSGKLHIGEQDEGNLVLEDATERLMQRWADAAEIHRRGRPLDIPVFVVSTVTGHGLPALRKFLGRFARAAANAIESLPTTANDECPAPLSCLTNNTHDTDAIPSNHEEPEIMPCIEPVPGRHTQEDHSAAVSMTATQTLGDALPLVLIYAVHELPVVGIVLTGTVVQGVIKVRDVLKLGPWANGGMTSVVVKSIRVERMFAESTSAGVASFAIEGLDPLSPRVSQKTSKHASPELKAATPVFPLQTESLLLNTNAAVTMGDETCPWSYAPEVLHLPPRIEIARKGTVLLGGVVATEANSNDQNHLQNRPSVPYISHHALTADELPLLQSLTTKNIETVSADDSASINTSARVPCSKSLQIPFPTVAVCEEFAVRIPAVHHDMLKTLLVSPMPKRAPPSPNLGMPIPLASPTAGGSAISTPASGAPAHLPVVGVMIHNARQNAHVVALKQLIIPGEPVRKSRASSIRHQYNAESPTLSKRVTVATVRFVRQPEIVVSGAPVALNTPAGIVFGSVFDLFLSKYQVVEHSSEEDSPRDRNSSCSSHDEDDHGYRDDPSTESFATSTAGRGSCGLTPRSNYAGCNNPSTNGAHFHQKEVV